MGKVKDITACIERLESIEEAVGVEFQGLFASCEANDDANKTFGIHVSGELLSREGMRLPERHAFIGAKITFYNKGGQVLDVRDIHIVNANDFFGVAPFREIVFYAPFAPSKIRIIPY
jgi:hypothetical protein